MLSEKMEKALNEQINAELYSAYLYLAMAAYFESQGLAGFANWMKVQAKEEQFHAEKFYGYVYDSDGRVILKGIEAPPHAWNGPLDAFQQVLKHERHVTALINNLMNLAIEEKDHATQDMLHWFVREQVEEENSARQIIDELKLVEGSGGGIFMINRELGQRVFTPPTAAAE